MYIKDFRYIIYIYMYSRYMNIYFSAAEKQKAFNDILADRVFDLAQTDNVPGLVTTAPPTDPSTSFFAKRRSECR